LLAKNQMRAAVYLNEAYKLGEDTPALRYMLARAMQLVDAEVYAVQSGRPISYVESSPDARRFLTVDDDWTLDLWDAADGHRLGQSRMPRFTSRWFQPSFDYSSRTLSYQGTEQDTGQSRYFIVDASNGRVLAALPTLPNTEFTIGSVDPAGRYAVYVAPDGAVHRYDLSRNRDERWLAGPKVLATYSRDGRWVISGTDDGKLELWDAHSSVRGPVLEGLNARPTSIASTADGSLLAASAIDGKLRVWDLRCRCVQLTAGHAGLAYLRFDRAGTHLISNGVDGVQVWDTDRQALVYAAQYANAQNGTLSRLSADGRRIARIAESRLAVRDTETGAEVFNLDGHLGPAASMFFSDDGVHMTSAGADGRAIVWRAPRMPLAEFRHPVNPRDLYRLGAYDPPVAAVFSRRGDRIASGGADGMVRIWAADGFELRQQWPADPSGVQVLAFSPDDTLLAVGGLGSLKLYDAASGSLARVLDERSPMVLRLRFSRDGRRLAVSTLGGIVRVWDVADGTRLFEGRRDGSRSQSLSADGQLLAFGHEGVVHLVRLADGRELWSRAIEEQPGTPSTEINAVEFSADGTRLAVGSYRNAVAVLDARDGRLLAEDHDPTSTNIAGVVFSHDGASVLVSDYNRQARVWRWQEGRLRRLDGHAEGLDAGSFSLDDALVYTWAKDGAVLAWDADSGLLLDRLGFHGSRVSPGDSAGELSPDGERLLSGSVDGVIRLWDIGRERRGPAAIERLLRCRSPWQLHATELQPVMPQDGACPRQSSPVRPTGGPALP
jgi:WD40 repeat protein